MTVTIKDIAKKAKCSITTVSRALNDYDDVSPATKKLVRKIADEMGYTPNTLAQRLQKQQTDTIGLILPTFGPRFSDPFFSEFLAGIGNKAAHYGYDLLVSTRAPGEQELLAYEHNIRTHKVDGFIIVRTRRVDKRIAYLTKSRFPFASFGRVEGEMGFPYIDEDGEKGMELVANHLASLGHRRIACIAPPDDLMFAHYRLKGLRDSLKRLDIPLDPQMILTGDLTQRSGYEITNALLDLPERPTAIIACNDLMALGAVGAIQDRGLTVGEEISVTGFDNIPMAETTHPSLTTINQPIYQIGSMVTEMLIQKLRGEMTKPVQILLTPTLEVRQSTGPIQS